MTDQNDFGSLQEFMAAFPDEEIAELDALGDNYNVNRWAIADKAKFYIEVLNCPAMWVYALISARTDRSTSTVRQSYYVAKFYHLHPLGLREKYNTLNYSIFKHASKTGARAEACLQYAFENQIRRPGELKLLFPAKEIVITDEVQIRVERSVPFWARPISRKIFELPADQRKTAQAVFQTLLGLLDTSTGDSIVQAAGGIVKSSNELLEKA